MENKYKFEKFNNPGFPVYSSVQKGEGVLVVPHFHKAAELIKVVSGKVEVIIDTVQTEYSENDIIFIPPYSFHSVEVIENSAEIKGLTFELPMLNINVPDIPMEQILGRERISRFVFDRGSDIYSSLNVIFENITEIYGENSDTYELDILSELYKLTALLIHEYNRGGAVTHTAEYSRIKPVIDYINENYNKKIYVSDLSKILHVCDDHTIRLFKSVTNKTPLRYITDVRIEEAMKLLINSSLPVSEISDRVGFSNANYMSQIFKLTLNMTPREYRKMIK